MNVPLFDITEQNAALAPELRAAFERVLESGRFILGEEVESLEAEVAAQTGTGHAVGLSSGTDALLVAMMALGIGPGDEVICPSFSFFATAGCVARLGAVPVFADCCPVCFNIDAADLPDRLSARTRAIVPVHLFGQTAAMEDVSAFARAHGLKVIEDAAQALGSARGGRPAGALGDAGAFSFFPTKNLGAFGDGGMLVTRDAELAEKARILRNHGMEPRYHHAMVGGNFRLDALQAALLRVKLPHLASYTEGRRRNAAYYTEKLAAIPGVAAREAAACTRACEETGAAGSGAIVLPAVHDGNEMIWNQYTIRVRGAGRRDALREHLARRGIGSEVYYPVPLHSQECFKGAAPGGDPLRGCEAASAEVLSLPIYPELSDAKKDRVIAAVGEFLGGRA